MIERRWASRLKRGGRADSAPLQPDTAAWLLASAEARPEFSIDWRLLRSGRSGAPSPDHGLVSCLCLTRGRLDHLQRTLRCFSAQTYENLELLLVYERLEPRAAELLEMADPRVRHVRIPEQPRLTQGARRNISLAASRGAFFCVWDDDDWHSPLRVEHQVARIVRNSADFCLLGQMIVLDETYRRAFLTPRRPWEPTLMCRRDLSAVAEGHPETEREDTPFVERLAQRHRMTVLERPELFVYTCHGSNRCDREHFEVIFSHSAHASTEDSARVAGVVSGEPEPCAPTPGRNF